MKNTKKTGPEDKPSTKKSTASAKPQDKEVQAKGSESKAKSAKKAGGTPRGKLAPKGTSFAPKGVHGKNWKLIDASGLTLGRMSTHIAQMLMGKLSPLYTPNNDTGDSVVVINASKVKLTGDKWNQKLYQHHTNFPGGIKTIAAKDMLAQHPERIIEKAVWRMLPKRRGHMARTWFSKLHVYAGDTHPHQAQKPEAVKLPNLGMGSN